MSQDIRLPPGEADIRVKASWFVPVDVEVLAVAPHMHRLGRDMKITAAYPDGRSVDLIHVPDWDPDWQGTYTFETPVHLPKGSTVHVVGRFDNSDRPGNPHQPPGSSSGATARPTRCASATSPSSRRARTSPGPARRTTSSPSSSTSTGEPLSESMLSKRRRK